MCHFLLPPPPKHKSTPTPNRVLDLEQLSPLTALTDLALEDNSIRAVSLGPAPVNPLVNGQRLVNLQVLRLAGNRLADLGDVERLAACGGLTALMLHSNPVAKRPVSSDTTPLAFI